MYNCSSCKVRLFGSPFMLNSKPICYKCSKTIDKDTIDIKKCKCGLELMSTIEIDSGYCNYCMETNKRYSLYGGCV